MMHRDTKNGEMDVYRLAGQRWKNDEVIKDRNGK